MKRVEGKVALVTGAASGLGAADARRLAEEGAKVVLTDVNETLGRETAASIPGALFVKLDVGSEEGWKAAIAATLAEFGALHILVNNAGIVRNAHIEACSLADFQLHQRIMLEGTFLGCKYAVPAIAASGGGSIINVSSIGAVSGGAELVAYAAAKAGVMSLPAPSRRIARNRVTASG